MLTVVVLSGFAYGGDSPQFRGPNRDGKFDEQGLLKAWPENGPPVAWVAKGIGYGYSSVDVVKGKIYVPGTSSDENGYIFVLSLDGAIEQALADAEKRPIVLKHAGRGDMQALKSAVTAIYRRTVSLKDPAGYVHNGKYMLQLLYDAIEDLASVVKAPFSGLVRPVE
jgi:hypothetical protein